MSVCVVACEICDTLHGERYAVRSRTIAVRSVQAHTVSPAGQEIPPLNRFKR